MKFEDPWGISWRIGNAIRRFSIRQMLTQSSAFIGGVSYAKPVFIIGAPRSGTTTLFHLLRETKEFAALEREGHELWRTFHHPRWSSWSSDILSAEDAHWFERRFANSFIRAKAAYYPLAARFLEKTPENSLRIQYLLALYPDATFIVLKRNPGDVLNSLINGWRHPLGKFRSYFVPAQLTIPGYKPSHQWCFALIPRWRELTSTAIPEIALRQWVCMHEHLLDARARVPKAQWIELHFEDMIDPSMDALTDLCQSIDTALTPQLLASWKRILATPLNSMSGPGLNKWLGKNKHEILPLLPEIQHLSKAFGYEIFGTGENISIRRQVGRA